MSNSIKVESRQITRHVKGIQIEHENRRYFVVSGLPIIDRPPTGLSPIDVTPGLFAVAVTGCQIRTNASAFAIKQAIESSHKGEPNFDGIDLSIMLELFPLIQAFQADSDYEFTSTLIRVLGALTACSYTDGPIGLDDNSLKKAQSIFEGACEQIPYEIILQGLLSISWGGCFLELYRVIEQLYPIPKLLKLTAVWPTNIPLNELAADIEKNLGWRPKENEALAELISSCDESTVTILSSAFCKVRTIKSDSSKISEDLYRLRNSLVHFRQALSRQDLSDAEWNLIIVAMLELSSELYRRYGEIYNQPIPSNLSERNKFRLHQAQQAERVSNTSIEDTRTVYAQGPHISKIRRIITCLTRKFK
jgi:hypothetical protein